MNSPITSFLNNILLEVALDSRVPSGIVDVNNNLHRQILAEKLAASGLNRQLVVEMVNKLAIMDGKFPERQAYNKDGWLVTFPTPDHKNAAIKKKTAFASDPTHGQGGMNLYYKRHGKQARQTSQGSSEVGATTTDKATAAPGAGQVNAPGAADAAGADSTLKKSGSATQTAPTPAAAPTATNAATDGNAPTDGTGSTTLPKTSATGTAASAGQPSTTPSTPQPAVPSQPTESPIVKLSIEYARAKQWRDAPYGDWTNDKGEQIAVTGLDGQVVPIRFVDREGLRSFAEKRMSDGISLHEELRRTRAK